MFIANSKVWITGAKRLASSICSSCVRCRILHNLKVQQKLADLTSPLHLPCPSFTNVGVDLCGPLVVHAMINKRANMKVWNVLFVCLNTKTVTMYLPPGYSTKDFFLVYNSHIRDHRIPALVHSDFDWDSGYKQEHNGATGR